MDHRKRYLAVLTRKQVSEYVYTVQHLRFQRFGTPTCLRDCMSAQKGRHQHSRDESSGSYLLSALQMSCDNLVRDTPCMTKAYKTVPLAGKTENT
jgi:hypothetical protein